MKYREAVVADVPQIMIVRNSVKENTLVNPELVSDEDCIEFITERGKGWVCEVEGVVVGFSIIDMKEHNVWALFIHPDHEKQGIGRVLHDTMMEWYFEQTSTTAWLGTDPATRAAEFYRRSGWVEVGKYGADEIKFEMTAEHWQSQK